MKARIVYNRILGGWYVVRGPHQAPLSGRFQSKAQAQEWLEDRKAARELEDRFGGLCKGARR